MSDPDPDSVRGYLEAGLKAHQAGALERAVTLFGQALILGPGNPDARHLLGVTLLGLGRADEALGHLERAADKYRNNPQVLANLGQAYLAVRRHDAAEHVFRKASRLQPNQVQFQVGIGAALALQGKLAEAEILLRRLSARFAESSLVWLNLGHVMRDQRRLEQALDCYRKASALDPMLAEAHNDAGRILHTLLRFADAEEQYRRCIALAPDYMPARCNLASVAMDRGNFAEAESECRDLIARAPEMLEGHTLLAAALGHQGRLLEARASHLWAHELAPDDDKLFENYAIALVETGRTNEGLRKLGSLMARDAASAGAQQVLGVSLLALGQLQDGWVGFALRPAALRLREKYAHLPLAQSLPANISGQHVCLMREQGLGDELFFLRYAPLLAARGARITYRAGAKLESMLERARSIDEVVGEIEPPPPAEAYMLIGDLPLALGDSGPSEPYMAPATADCRVRDFDRLIRLYWPTVPQSLTLAPLPDKLEKIRARLAVFGAPPYIGLTWRGGTAPEEQGAQWVLHKAVGLAALASALRGAPGTLIALQRNPAGDEIGQLSRMFDRPVHDLTALNDDLETMLALLDVLDEYVGVSNTNMHLRAAVGKPARVLVPVPAEWRWMQFGRESPWFPGFTVYRQSLNGDWTKALHALNRDLAPR